MHENTGRHAVISTPATLRQNRTDRVDVRSLRDAQTGDSSEVDGSTAGAEKNSETAPASTPRPERTANAAESAPPPAWLEPTAISSSLLGEPTTDTMSSADIESAILSAVREESVGPSHANVPNLPHEANGAPTAVFETSARTPESQPTERGEPVLPHPASELDELVLAVMIGATSPDAKVDTTAPVAHKAAATSSPRVTIVMPSYNEEKFIETCIASVQAQDYDRDAIEILVADGRSSDRTREILARLAKDDPRIRVIDNPARLQAAGLGLAVKEARGEIIVRMDVHAEYAPDYVRQCVATLEKTGAQNVGGAQRARAKSLFQKALCVALGSKLGTGGAGYRHEDAEGFVDTVFLGAFRRKVFETVGLWDPNAITNEDSELNQRILENGGTIYLSKDIVVHYYPRDSLKALATQYFRYGRGRARTLLKLGKVPTVRPFLPFLAMTGLAATALLPPLWPLAPLAFGAYALATGAEAIRIGRGLGPKGVATVWSIFPTLHASHAAGVWAGLVRYLRAKDWTDAPETVAPMSMQTELPLAT